MSASGLSVSHVRATWSIRVSRVSVVVSGSVVGVVGLVVSVSSGVLCSRGVGCRAVVVVVVVVVVVPASCIGGRAVVRRSAERHSL